MIDFVGSRTRSLFLDLDVASSRRMSQTQDEVSHRKMSVISVRQAHAAVDCARLCREVCQGVCEAKIRSELVFVDDEARRSLRTIFVEGDDLEFILAFDSQNS